VHTWLVVWFVIGIVSALALVVCLVGLGRHVLILGRTLKRFQEEAQPFAEEISRGGAEAGERASNLGPTRAARRS